MPAQGRCSPAQALAVRPWRDQYWPGVWPDGAQTVLLLPPDRPTPFVSYDHEPGV